MSEDIPDGATRALARRVARPVDAAARAHAVRVLVDTLGCLAGARDTPEARIVRATSGADTGPEARAFVWGALAHTLELDDLHRASVTHPACVVIPAALVIARGAAQPSRDATLDAIVRGYEVMTRIGEAVGAAHYRIFHNTATCGPFGAAAACASLLGLDEERSVWALGNAGSVAGGLWQFNVEATATKPLHAGHASRSGVTAARLAANGLTGPERILEGPRGFFAAFCGADARPGALSEPASGWKIAETSFKPWGSCRHTHPAIDAALRLATLEPAAITGVVVRGYRTIAELCDAPAPASPARARFSVQHCVAVALARGEVAIGAFDEATVADPTIAALRARVRFEVDPRFDTAYPGQWGSEVQVLTADGHEHRAEALSPRGDPEAPLSDDDLDSKARGLIVHGVGWSEGEASDVLAAVRDPAHGLAPVWRVLDAACGPGE
ncbi:MAG: MmgE/PrpD family protein [Deltaproteobacteria bacterium]|nr:MmgE/PrpD family protein [Deltaproteobacteria bacterium]